MRRLIDEVVLDYDERSLSSTMPEWVAETKAFLIAATLSHGGGHRLDNGLLLRSDVHTLYDRGYVGVDPRHRLLVSPALREEFGNGEQLHARAGQAVAVPDLRADRPSREFLGWHLDEVFKAS